MNSPEQTERLKIGTRLSKRLQPLEKRSRGEVANIMGLSREAVRQIECLALWKIAKRLNLETEFTEENIASIPAAITLAKLREDNR